MDSSTSSVLRGTQSPFDIVGGHISWKSKKQPTVAMSTMDAEYMASSDATRQALFLRQLLRDFGLAVASPVTLHNDNMGAISLAKNPVHHDKAKHIDIRHHFIREKLEDKSIDLQHVASKSNVADILTKPLPRDLYTAHTHNLGLVRTHVAPSGSVNSRTTRTFPDASRDAPDAPRVRAVTTDRPQSSANNDNGDHN
jgi:hypothetical protein